MFFILFSVFGVVFVRTGDLAALSVSLMFLAAFLAMPRSSGSIASRFISIFDFNVEVPHRQTNRERVEERRELEKRMLAEHFPNEAARKAEANQLYNDHQRSIALNTNDFTPGQHLGIPDTYINADGDMVDTVTDQVVERNVASPWEG